MNVLEKYKNFDYKSINYDDPKFRDDNELIFAIHNLNGPTGDFWKKENQLLDYSKCILTTAIKKLNEFYFKKLYNENDLTDEILEYEQKYSNDKDLFIVCSKSNLFKIFTVIKFGKHRTLIIKNLIDDKIKLEEINIRKFLIDVVKINNKNVNDLLKSKGIKIWDQINKKWIFVDRETKL